LTEISLVQNNFCHDHSFVITAIKITHSSFVQSKIILYRKSWNNLLQMKHPQMAQFSKDSVEIYVLPTSNQFKQIETSPQCQYMLDRIFFELFLHACSLLFYFEQIT